MFLDSLLAFEKCGTGDGDVRALRDRSEANVKEIAFVGHREQLDIWQHLLDLV